MRLCRIAGDRRPAIVDDEGNLRDASSVVDDITSETIAAGGISRLIDCDVASLPMISGEKRLAEPVGGIGKVVCAGMNYTDHCEEAGFPIPDQPALFMKATTALCGPNDDIAMPQGATQLDWEVELAAVIAKRAVNVPEAQALDYVAGYTILNDVSDRDFQFNHGGQWFKGKSADTFCPIGPWLVTPDEVGDPQALELFLDLNGKRMQSGHTGKMIFSVAALINHASRYMTLMPGDILSTGTPPGVGMGQKPQRFLKPGDRLRLGITALGEQSSTIVQAAPVASVA